MPVKLRPRVLELLHQAHQEVVCMKARVRQSFWWPEMSVAIDQTRAQCRHCNIIMPEPEYPWQYAVADYFSWKGCNYFTVADGFSG